MLQTSKFLAICAFALVLISAPFMSSAKADGGHHHRHYEHKAEKLKHWKKAHRRLHHAEKRHDRPHHWAKHHKRARIRKHRRPRHAWNHHAHDHHRKPAKKVVYKVVEVEPKYDPQERLVAALIEAVVRSSTAAHYR